MRKNLLCEHLHWFGKKYNPCRKVLVSLIAEKIVQKEDDEIEVEGLEQITLKCSRKGCGRKTVINIKEAK